MLAADDVVIGQSLPLGGAAFSTASRIVAGADAALRRINATGGIAGRPLRIVTLDDEGDPRRHAANVRRLLAQEGAVALVNCVGDLSCIESAAVATDRRVPLIGPLSGAAALQTGGSGYVVPVRPPYSREASALTSQLRAMGITSVAVLSDGSDGAERSGVFAEAAKRLGLQVTTISTGSSDAALEAAFAGIARANVQAVLLDVGDATVSAMARRTPPSAQHWPRTLLRFSSPGVTMLARLFPDRLVAYTMVVPNAESSTLPLARELQADADGGPGPAALTFEGTEAYLNVRLAALALRRAAPVRSGHAAFPGAIEGLGPLAIGGFPLVPGRPGKSASDWVDVGYRQRHGLLLR
ncbi:MAG TPA: ABC transporter substrate-binding protein [Burkholderiaceae bacterium]|nr:ABC transporter substrate-binding protein [Burkholderiaceae bacterium]